MGINKKYLYLKVLTAKFNEIKSLKYVSTFYISKLPSYKSFACYFPALLPDTPRVHNFKQDKLFGTAK